MPEYPRLEAHSLVHELPSANWPTALANAMATALDGDTIVVHDSAMQVLATATAARLYPHKRLLFCLGVPEDAWPWQHEERA
jgi:hypothetical protein